MTRTVATAAASAMAGQVMELRAAAFGSYPPSRYTRMQTLSISTVSGGMRDMSVTPASNAADSALTVPSDRGTLRLSPQLQPCATV